MNYVKHVSIALWVLGSASLNVGSALSIVSFRGAPQEVLPLPQVPHIAAQHAQDVAAQAARIRNLEEIGLEAAANRPICLETGVFARVKGIFGDWLGERASLKSRVGIGIALGALAGVAGKMVEITYNPIPGFTGIAVASYITNPTSQAIALGALISLAGKMVGSAYKTIPAFKSIIDSSVQSASDFINDVKDGNGNARRNAQIGIATVAAAIVGYYSLLSSGEAIQEAMQ